MAGHSFCFGLLNGQKKKKRKFLPKTKQKGGETRIVKKRDVPPTQGNVYIFDKDWENKYKSKKKKDRLFSETKHLGLALARYVRSISKKGIFIL